MKPSVQQIEAIFNCTTEQVRAQFAKNKATLSGMARKAEKSGKKLNGYAPAQLWEIADTIGNNPLS